MTRPDCTDKQVRSPPAATYSRRAERRLGAWLAGRRAAREAARLRRLGVSATNAHCEVTRGDCVSEGRLEIVLRIAEPIVRRVLARELGEYDETLRRNVESAS